VRPRPGIEVFIIATDDPQLRDCQDSVYALEFDKVSEIRDVIPISKAVNQAIRALEYSRALLLAGDMILYPEAYSLIYEHTYPPIRSLDVYQWGFGLFDLFLNQIICCAAVVNTEVVKKFERKDLLGDDFEAALRAEKKGYQHVRLWKDGVVIGTHFDQPSTFQIFRRFYVRGAKARKKNSSGQFKKYHQQLLGLFDSFNKEEYRFAARALEFGYKDENYPGSNNLDYDREMYRKCIKH